MTMDVKRTPVYGTVLEKNPLPTTRTPFLTIPGQFRGQSAPLTLDKETLSKHTMLIGGTGCGKSNVFYHMINGIRRQMTPEDVMIVFDTKGDYYRLFARPGDVVIGGGRAFADRTVKWSLFREILSDGWKRKDVELNTQELSWAIFRESIQKSKDPLFPNAARDLFAAILLCMIRQGVDDPDYRRDCLNNGQLKRALDESTIFEVKEMLENRPEYASVLSYIGDGTTGQALGVYAEMLGTARKLLTDCFAQEGDFSIRDFVRSRGGRILFVEYDISIGDVLAPVYSLLFDQALKEALGRGQARGDVYLICDEFRLLPYLQHIDDGVNFGRSLGVKVIAGLQSINQLTEAYGDARGKNILAGFSSVYAFRANDTYTRDYVVGLHGKNVVLEQTRTLSNSVREERREAHTVEDWDMNDLQVGEAVVSLPFGKPFRYRFDLYRGR